MGFTGSRWEFGSLQIVWALKDQHRDRRNQNYPQRHDAVSDSLYMSLNYSAV
jgi:hypothetical protein